jgi:hypothetical protein
MVILFNSELKGASVRPITVRERKLKFGVHNTLTYVNTGGIENSISLVKKDHILVFKGVVPIERFFYHDYNAFVLELVYTCKIL